MRTLAFVAVLLLMAALLRMLSTRWPAQGRLAGVNEFVGRSLGHFAVGLLFLLLVGVAFQRFGVLQPGESQVERNRRAIDSLRIRVDTLEGRVGVRS